MDQAKGPATDQGVDATTAIAPNVEKGASDGPPKLPDSIGTPGLTGAVEEGGKLVRAGSTAEAGALDTPEQLGPVGAATRGNPPVVDTTGAANALDVAPATILADTATPPGSGPYGAQRGPTPGGEGTSWEPTQRETLVVETVGVTPVGDAASAALAPEPPSRLQRLVRSPALRFGLPLGALVVGLLVAVLLKRRGPARPLPDALVQPAPSPALQVTVVARKRPRRQLVAA